MGGCEVREFLWQFGFFLPLRTAWPGYCSHVSNNQDVLPPSPRSMESRKQLNPALVIGSWASAGVGSNVTAHSVKKDCVKKWTYLLKGRFPGETHHQ
nr:uncharacterized protein LOC100726696 isoform X1 [Cavia porcellus]XP_013002811.1 uncharacterized protein LOC100726696 isoform X1 [Cavia porcellus]XP_013002827.1 uncharacterized protein LOC100726696 isoform X1 [Cavia porcellus]XP_023418726.1 uncharacterized protein LOC100726696 isoform X1 [Cavia porcellus]